jgi:acyl carrier protein
MQEQKDPAAMIRSFVLQRYPAARKHPLDDHAALLTSGIIDSLGMLDLVGFLEKSFAIQLSDDELTPENFASIASLTLFVEMKRAQIGAVAQ